MGVLYACTVQTHAVLPQKKKGGREGRWLYLALWYPCSSLGGQGRECCTAGWCHRNTQDGEVHHMEAAPQLGIALRAQQGQEGDETTTCQLLDTSRSQAAQSRAPARSLLRGPRASEREDGITASSRGTSPSLWAAAGTAGTHTQPQQCQAVLRGVSLPGHGQHLLSFVSKSTWPNQAAARFWVEAQLSSSFAPESLAIFSVGENLCGCFRNGLC